MSNKLVLKVVNLSKRYHLGVVGGKTMKADIKRFYRKFFNSKNINLDEGEENDRTIASSSSNYVWSLRDVNFEVQKGDVVGIIGRNGAGKSTLLKILSRITAPTSGEVRVNGKIASLLEVGTGFHPELTGRENIYLNGSILGMSKAEINQKIDAIIDFAEIQRYIDTPVKRYSSGMYVRLAFSIAAHLEPDILILDEVLAVGDSSFQKKCIDKMAEISQNEGRTILFVSHMMASIQSLCNKVILLEKGSVKFIGDVDEGIAKYLEMNQDIKDHEQIEFSNQRKGNQKIIFSDFYFESKEGKKIDKILTGQDLILVFILKKNSTENINDIDLGFSIHDNYDQGLANLYSSYQNVFFTSNENYMTIKFVLPTISFSPGNIGIRGRILVSGEESDFYLHKLGEILIEMGDFYNTGVIGQSNWGKYLIKGQWLKD